MTDDIISPAQLPPAAREALLALARRTVVAIARTGKPGDPGQPSPGLDSPAGVFVTLHVGGELRGCIGTFDASRSLWRTVHEMAAAAATRDPRFPAVAVADLDALTLSISVLSPLRPVASAAEIEVGRHGIEVSRGLRRGVLLPQVAIEHGLDREAFLAETCRKAGLPDDAWRDGDTQLRVFEAEVLK